MTEYEVFINGASHGTIIATDSNAYYESEILAIELGFYPGDDIVELEQL